MTGLEIENLSEASVPAAARTENLTAREPAEKYYFVRLGNIKLLAVHFFNSKAEMSGDTLCDRMSGVDVPDSFSVAVSPAEITGCAHKRFKNLGVVTRMKNNESHACKHSLMYFFNELIGNLIVCHVTPPDKYIRGFKNFIRKTAAALCESCGADIEILLR